MGLTFVLTFCPGLLSSLLLRRQGIRQKVSHREFCQKCFSARVDTGRFSQ
ncbi:hypothetical protein PSPHG_CDS_0101 [Pseudomonas phage Psxphi15]